MKFETARWMPAMSRRGIQVLTSVVVTIAAAVALLLRAIPDLWVALEVDPMSAKTHAKAARVLIATWPSLDEHTRTHSGEIIDRAINLNRGNQFLKDAAASLGISRGRS